MATRSENYRSEEQRRRKPAKKKKGSTRTKTASRTPAPKKSRRARKKPGPNIGQEIAHSSPEARFVKSSVRSTRSRGNGGPKRIK